MQIAYATGRDYGAPQVLTIIMPATLNDPIADVRVTFRDDVRGIAGAVTLMGFELDSDVGAAVLREYDAGRYQLI